MNVPINYNDGSKILYKRVQSKIIIANRMSDNDKQNLLFFFIHHVTSKQSHLHSFFQQSKEFFF